MEAIVSLGGLTSGGRAAVWHQHRPIIKADKVLFESYVLYRHSWLVGKFHWHHRHTDSDIKW